tara:strand:+ start:723 stop:1844 length:1122 start_codon:yes stop_codon:yes gene_type:complete
MSNWIERLKEEKSEFEAKIKDLHLFMASNEYYELEPVDVSLMEELMIAMEDCLGWVNDGLERAGAKNCQIDLNSMFLDGIDKSLIEHYYKTEAPKEEYVTSSTANADNVNKAKEVLEDAMDKHLDAEKPPKFYDEPETMIWNAAMDKYDNHPVYRLMTREELLVEYKENSNDYKAGSYWSSSEYNNGYAGFVDFNNGYTFNYGKYNTYRVRVVNKEMVDCKVDEHEVALHSSSEGVKAFQAAIDEYVEKDTEEKRYDVIDDEKRAFNGIFNQVTQRAKEMFPEDLNESMDDITQTEITPKALIVLGFEENYQFVGMGNPGYIYYTLHLLGMELCSSVVGDDKPFHVVAGDEGEFIIHNLRKLGDLILSLKELS